VHHWPLAASGFALRWVPLFLDSRLPLIPWLIGETEKTVYDRYSGSLCAQCPHTPLVIKFIGLIFSLVDTRVLYTACCQRVTTTGRWSEKTYTFSTTGGMYYSRRPYDVCGERRCQFQTPSLDCGSNQYCTPLNHRPQTVLPGHAWQIRHSTLYTLYTLCERALPQFCTLDTKP